MDISTSLAGIIHLETPIYNASGPRCTTREELYALNNCESAAILTKSCTVEPRLGNPGIRYWDNDIMSINSTGLANLGYKFYGEQSGFSKPYIVSVAGLTLEDNLEIVKELDQDHISSIELNLSCPNISGKPQVAYDYEMIETYLRKIYDTINWEGYTIGVKLSPYFDHEQFVQVADILNEYPIGYVTCINSLGYGLMLDVETETTVIAPNSGHGGVGGRSIYPISLANVNKFRKLLNDDIDVVGCGGVTTGQDVFGYLLCGASAVQVGTQFMKEGVGVFSRLNKELVQIMKGKGYTKISDFKGKLNVRKV